MLMVDIFFHNKTGTIKKCYLRKTELTQKQNSLIELYPD